MNFIEKIIELFFNLGEHLSNLFTGFIQFLTLPFAFLLSLLEGIFHFISVIFQVVILIIQIFVALFQYFFGIVSSMFLTISNMVGFAPTGSMSLDLATRLGFDTALEQVGGTGLLTVVPNVFIAITWLFFAYKLIGLFQNKGEISEN